MISLHNPSALSKIKIPFFLEACQACQNTQLLFGICQFMHILLCVVCNTQIRWTLISLAHAHEKGIHGMVARLCRKAIRSHAWPICSWDVGEN